MNDTNTTIADEIREWGNFCSVSANDPTGAEQAWEWAERVEADAAARQAEIDTLRADLAELRRDRDWPAGLYRMQGKIERQRKALDAMNRRQASLRFALRVHEQVNGPLSREQWAEARDALVESNPSLANRVTEVAPAAA